MGASLFHVSFFKKLTDSTGHVHDCCQGEVDVLAHDEARATAVARERFAGSKHITNWTLYADYEVVKIDGVQERASVTGEVTDRVA
jgi:hypothetical protein